MGLKFSSDTRTAPHKFPLVPDSSGRPLPAASSGKEEADPTEKQKLNFYKSAAKGFTA